MERISLSNESVPGNAHLADFEGKNIDVYKLIHLAEAVTSKSVPLATFEGHKLSNYWHDSRSNWLSPQDIITACKDVDDPYQLIKDEALDSGLREHIKKVLDADYVEYPIITINGVVVDGMHRLTKAFIDGIENIDVKDFEKLPSSVVVNL